MIPTTRQTPNNQNLKKHPEKKEEVAKNSTGNL